MSLDPETKRTITRWIKAKCPGFRCPACGGTTWDVPGVYGNQLLSSPNSVTYVTELGIKEGAWADACCETCGHSSFFRLDKMNLTSTPT